MPGVLGGIVGAIAASQAGSVFKNTIAEELIFKRVGKDRSFS
jgi:hypothetical protein